MKIENAKAAVKRHLVKYQDVYLGVACLMTFGTSAYLLGYSTGFSNGATVIGKEIIEFCDEMAKISANA